MTKEEIALLKSKQYDFFNTGATIPVKFRKEMLSRLYMAIKENEAEIKDALREDLGKSEFEAYMCEVGMALSEISFMIKKLKSFSKPKRVKTPLAQFPSKSYVLPSPRGTVLIMSPWNYPLLLTVGPLANALAAGNCAIVKPSAYSPMTSAALKRILESAFPRELVAVVTGGRAENSALLEEKYDLVFFTGSGNVGKEVLRHTAENLTPAVLELGGKSPCIVDSTAKLPLAARRIVFGKFLNAGQTCVAPDYVLCDERIKDKLKIEIAHEIERQLGDDPLKNPEYGKIINEKHFDRLLELIDTKKLYTGGGFSREELKIEPTVLESVAWEDKVMGEEIFGPILPIVTYIKEEEIIKLLADKPKPLALYLFSENKALIKRLTERLSFGGGCINDTIIHLATSEMGFGGVGESGMGAYHGKVGFDTFSHRKSIVKKSTRIDLPMRYRPHKPFYRRLLGRFLK